MPREGTAFNLYLPKDVRGKLEQQAEALRRSLHAEILHAIERHLAAPPRLVEPELPGATVRICLPVVPLTAAQRKDERSVYSSNEEMNMCVYFNNCCDRDFVELYGEDAFYDLNDWGQQANMATGIQIGQECVVASYVPGTNRTEVEFRHFRLSRVTNQLNPTDPEERHCRVFWGDFIRSVRHPKAIAATTPPYNRFFDIRGHFLQRSVV